MMWGCRRCTESSRPLNWLKYAHMTIQPENRRAGDTAEVGYEARNAFASVYDQIFRAASSQVTGLISSSP